MLTDQSHSHTQLRRSLKRRFHTQLTDHTQFQLHTQLKRLSMSTDPSHSHTQSRKSINRLFLIDYAHHYKQPSAISHCAAVLLIFLIFHRFPFIFHSFRLDQ
uniref:Uncharacterized protein n=1 Tax=Cacopsylla melanoneura TaxID=428564 RepID=A0A8D8XPQ8_9HEMI